VSIIPPDVAAPETLPGWLYQLAERYGDAEALVEPAGEVRTFGELGRRVTALSQTLAEAGVRHGAIWGSPTARRPAIWRSRS
jgi:non-ribosomal peptide synthetase component F